MRTSARLSISTHHLTRVRAALTDTAKYSTWNPFITKLGGTLAVGQKLDVRIAPPGGKPMSFRPTVTDVQPQH